jgi:hypothetical protein
MQDARQKSHGPPRPRIRMFLRHDEWWSLFAAALLPCSASCLSGSVARIQGPEIALRCSLSVRQPHRICGSLSPHQNQTGIRDRNGSNIFRTAFFISQQLLLLQVVEYHVARQGNPAPTEPAHLTFMCRGHGFLSSPVTDR